MDNKRVLIDSSVFIDFYRAKQKDKTLLVKIKRSGFILCTSSIVQYEVLCGSADEHLNFWKEVFDCMDIFPFDSLTVIKAREIFRDLRRKNKLIEACDILVAATALTNELQLATLNTEHFDRICLLSIWK